MCMTEARVLVCLSVISANMYAMRHGIARLYNKWPGNISWLYLSERKRAWENLAVMLFGRYFCIVAV